MKQAVRKRWSSTGPGALGALTLALNLVVVTPAGAAPPSADLEIRMMGWSDPVAVGDEFTYYMTIDNHGPDAASRVTFDDPLPPELTLVSVTASDGTCSGDTTARCDLGTLTYGGAVDVAVTVRADREGTVTNTASVASQRSDPSTSNNSASATTTIVSKHGDPPANNSACYASLQQATCRLWGQGGPVSVFGWAVDPVPYGGCQGYPACVYPMLTSVQLTVTVSTLGGEVVVSCSNSLSAGSGFCVNTSATVVDAGTELLCQSNAWDSHGHPLIGEFGCVAGP